MNDQDIMQSLLISTKGVCDLYLHGTVESATPNVHKAFDDALNESLCMQSGIYSKMAEKGWYPSTQAPPQSIQQVKTKFQNAQ